MKKLNWWMLITVFIYSCSVEQGISVSPSRRGLNGVIIGFRLFSTDSGVSSWLLVADSALSRLSDTNDVYGIQLTFYTEQGMKSSDIFADSGKQVVKTRDLFASGNLLIKSYPDQQDSNSWEIYGDSIWQRVRKNQIDIYNLRLLWFDSLGNEKAEIIADSGTYFVFSKDLRAQGNLSIHTSSGGILLTETLFYHQDRNMFATDLEVTYIEGDNILKGVGFESDPHMDNIRVFHAVRGTIVADEL
ncbi:MAG: hypothetical protein APR63_02745 [Desulfuromonas sp. SDB]|nr:MAG: hypothetical protein APR63_02745 [Desulfuromonas sp. SDB]